MKESYGVGVVKLFVYAVFIVCYTGCAPMSDIQKATSLGDLTRVDQLLDRGDDINDFSPVHGTPLRIAAEKGDMAMVIHLLDQGADLDPGSPLTGTALAGHVDIARLLIDRGADVNNGGWNADSPLEQATRENQQGMVALLLTAHANPDGDGRGQPLWIASYRGYDDIVRQLLQAGADPNLQDCLDMAVRHSSSDNTTRLLLEGGADVKRVDGLGMTPLHSGALYGRTERVRLLLEYGADKKSKDNSGKTPESYALEEDYQAVLKLLSSQY